MTTKTGLLEGTSRTIDHQDKRGDGAVDRAWVDGLTPGNTSLDAAVAAASAAAGILYSQDSTLYQGKTQATLIRPTAAMVVNRYMRGPTSKPTDPAWAMLQTRTGYWNLRYYTQPLSFDADGRPNAFTYSNPFLFTTSNAQRWSAIQRPLLSAYALPVAYTEYRMHTVVDNDPRPALANLKDATNTARVTLPETCNPAGMASGQSFGPHELWFRGAAVETVSVPTTVSSTGFRYIVDYVIWAMDAPGWVEQFYVLGDPGLSFDTTRTPSVDLSLTFEVSVTFITQFYLRRVIPIKLSNFSQIFPVHTP